MSTFDEWCNSKNYQANQKAAWSAGYRQGWNAALDGLEGLVDEWDKESSDMSNWGVKQGHRICADKLKTRIEELELREES